MKCLPPDASKVDSGIWPAFEKDLLVSHQFWNEFLQAEQWMLQKCLEIDMETGGHILNTWMTKSIEDADCPAEKGKIP